MFNQTTPVMSKRSIFLTNDEVMQLQQAIASSKSEVVTLQDKQAETLAVIEQHAKQANALDEQASSLTKQAQDLSDFFVDDALVGKAPTAATVSRFGGLQAVASTLTKEAEKIRLESIAMQTDIEGQDTKIRFCLDRQKTWSTRLTENEQAREFQSELQNGNPERVSFLCRAMDMSQDELFRKFEVVR